MLDNSDYLRKEEIIPLHEIPMVHILVSDIPLEIRPWIFRQIGRLEGMKTYESITLIQNSNLLKELIIRSRNAIKK